MKDESILIKKILDGDEDAFEEIVEEYKNYIFAIILSFIKDYNEVENVAQEVFLQIYLSLHKYKSDNFKAWISRIASNKSIDWLRKKRAKFREEVVEDEDFILSNNKLIQSITPEEILLEKEKKEEISKLCKSIPDIYESAIVKFYLDGKSYEEIAMEEGTTVKTIASRLYRGRNMLKEKWRERL